MPGSRLAGCPTTAAVILPTVTDREMRAAQVFTGATLALWLAFGYVPAIRRYHARI